MHDKQVRRRRAVLALLVGVSLILLTAYFGESPSSPLHSVQRAIVQVLSPIQKGTSTVLSPVRDVAGFFSDTFNAKSRADRLQVTVNRLTKEVDALEYQAIQNRELSREVKLDNAIGTAGYDLVGANVIERDPTFWYQTIEVDKGSADGVHLGDPVVGDGALVGNVTTVDSSYSVVTLITDHTLAVAAMVEDGQGDTGLVEPAVGNPNQLLLQDLPNTQSTQNAIQVGDPVVTAGFKYGDLQDYNPPGLPIGTVTTVNPYQLDNNQEVGVTPAADLRHLTSVQILTRPHPGSSLRAQVGAP